MQLIHTLSRLSFSRPSGTPEEKQAAELLAGEILALGFEPDEETFSYERRVPVRAELRAE